jgi:glycosyltransferase involved in cell wall biosynthesis
LKLNPVKTLEYLAAGVPVVSTAIPDVIRFFGEVVRVANDHDAFVSEVRSALESDNRSRREAGFKLARSASWQAMADRMSALLQGTTSKGDPV